MKTLPLVKTLLLLNYFCWSTKFYAVGYSLMSAIMLVSFTLEETEDGAGNTAVVSNSNKLFLLERLCFILDI